MVGPVQEMRARNLQTLIAVLDEYSGVTDLAPDGSGSLTSGANPDAVARLRAALNGVGTPSLATVLQAPQGNRLTLGLGGTPLEVVLPDTLAHAAKLNPALLARGTLLQVEIDARIGVLRLSLPAPEVSNIATLRNISQSGGGPSASAARPLPDYYPPGSPGALIQRLAQFHLPLAERGDARPGPASGPPISGSRGLGPSALATLPPALLEASLKAAIRQLPLGTAISALLSGDAKGANPVDLAALRALRLDAFAAPDATEIEQGVKQSGLFFEARLAGLAQGQGGALPHDLKSLLTAILSGLGGRTEEKGDNPRPIANHLLAVADRPEAPAPRGLDLARLVEGGLERIKLLQIASLPDHPGMTVTDDRSQTSRLTLQIPLATQGPDRPETAMIGLMIEHQPRPDQPPGFTVEDEGKEGGETFPWKVRIALDLEETGPVQAEIALRGQRIGITLWAERRTMAEDARRAIGELHAALTEAAFEVAHLDVRDGRPTGTAVRASAQLDRRL